MFLAIGPAPPSSPSRQKMRTRLGVNFAGAVVAGFLLAQLGLEYMDPEIGHGLHPLMTRLLQRLQAEQPALVGQLLAAEVLPALDRHYAATVGTQARPYPGVPEALDVLRQAATTLLTEANGVSDNPLIFTGSGEALSAMWVRRPSRAIATRRLKTSSRTLAEAACSASSLARSSSCSYARRSVASRRSGSRPSTSER